MAKIGTYPAASALDGTEELVGVQSAASVKLTPEQIRDYVSTRYLGQNLQTGTAYELVLGDAGFLVEMNNAASNILTIPANSAVAFPVDTIIDVVQGGAGITSITITTDTLNGDVVSTGQWKRIRLWKRTATEWVATGVDPISSAGGLTPVFISGNYTASAGEEIFVGILTAAITVTLPATPVDADHIIIHGGPSAAQYNVTVDGDTTDTIDGDLTFVIDQNYGECNVAYEGTTDNEWKNAPIGFPDLMNINDYVTGVETMWVFPEEFAFSAEASQVTVQSILKAIQLNNHGSVYAQAHFAKTFPKKWDGGAIRWRMKWVPSATNTGTATCHLIGHFQAEGDLIVAGGTANMEITDTPNGTVDDLHISAWSAWQTPDGTGDENKLYVGRIQRQGPVDAFTGAVKIVNIEIQYTTNAATDD